MTDSADYLRPFAAEEPAYSALWDRAPVASPAPWPAPPAASGYLPEYLPPPYDRAEHRDPPDGYLPAPGLAPPEDQAYRLRGPFTPLTVPPPQDDILAAGSAADTGLSRGYPSGEWHDSANPGQPMPASQPMPAGQPWTARQPWPASQPEPARQPMPASQPWPASQPMPASQPAPASRPEPPTAALPTTGVPTTSAPTTSGAGPARMRRRSRPRWTSFSPARPVGRDGTEIVAGKRARGDAGAGDAIPVSGPGLAAEADPPAPGTFRERSGAGRSRGGRWISAAAAAGVVIIAAVAAIILLTQGKPAASAGHGSTPGRGASGPQRQPAAAPTASAGPLTVTPAAAAGPDAKAVARLVTRYFRAINEHDFALYRTLFSASLRGGLSSAAFARGYGTSHDSLATLQGITSAGARELDAAVSFTSHQQPADTPSHSTCTRWNISLYLVRQGHGYVIVSPPAGYEASFGTCT